MLGYSVPPRRWGYGWTVRGHDALPSRTVPFAAIMLGTYEVIFRHDFMTGIDIDI